MRGEPNPRAKREMERLALNRDLGVRLLIFEPEILALPGLGLKPEA